MNIEVTVSLNVSAGLSFDVEPGTVVTREIIDAKIAEIQNELDRGGIESRSAALYVSILDFDRQVDIDTYDIETGVSGTIQLGQPAISEPA